MNDSFAQRVLVAALLMGGLLVETACAPDVPPLAAPAPVVATAVAPAPSPDASRWVRIQVLAINDLHGHLDPPSGSSGTVLARVNDPALPRADAGVLPNHDAGTAVVPAGGAAYLVAHLRRLREDNPNTVIVSAGDLTGASPLLSSMFSDEPTVLVMNRAGLDFEGVGNHDFDRGIDELVRLQRGGCSLGDCDAGRGAFPGATFEYLAANVRSTADQKTVFPPYAVKDLAGAKIAFVGVTLEATPTIATPRATRGLAFAGEAATVNALVPELESQGVSAIVLLVHQGGVQTKDGTYDACEGLAGDILPVLRGDPTTGRPALSPLVEVVVSGHTHQAYDCVLDGRIVTSAASYGRLITKIDLTIDPSARRVVDKHAKNVVVTRDIPPDTDALRIIGAYKAQALPRMQRVVGAIGGDFGSDAHLLGNASCETPLGDLIADAQLAATREVSHGGAQVAFMNPGGIRADLVARGADKADLTVTYAEAFDVQPFGNQLVTMTLTGAQIQTLLGAQFGHDRPRVLQVSEGFTYAYAYDRSTRKAAIDPKSIRLRGAPLDLAKPYRVTVNSFLAGGGDEFAVLEEGTDRVAGAIDVDALIAYLGVKGSPKAPLPPPRAPTRIRGDACR
jgi:5'-nucleotidase